MSHFRRILGYIVLLQVLYLVVFNAALNIPLTQDLINRIKPDKFFVSWEQAWTPYPFRVFAHEVMANGQSRSQQWELAAPEAGGTISLFPLLYKKVSLKRVSARDVTYRQRPRPRADKDHSNIREYFPPIQGRNLETSPPSLPAPKTGKKAWHIEIQDMHASGDHTLWLYQVQAQLRGDARTDLSVQTRGGPVSLSNGEVDIEVQSITLNGDREVTRDGQLRGSVALLPLVVKENRGIAALSFLELDVAVKSQVENLAFLNLYLSAFEGMKLGGKGEVAGRLVLSKGQLLAESELNILAQTLNLSLLEYRVEGDGNVNIQVPEPSTGAAPDTQFAIAFNDLDAFHGENPAPLLTGNGLVFNGTGSNNIIPLEDSRPEAKSLALSISSLKVLDLSRFQHFLPPVWPFKLHGGVGELLGQIAVNQNEFSSNLKLRSTNADIGFNDFRFSSDLDMALIVDSPELAAGRIEVTGTHIRINETEVSNQQQASGPWHAFMTLEKGIINLKPELAEAGETPLEYIFRMFREKDIGAILAASDEDLVIKGEISDLAWLNVLIKNPYDLKIHGSGGMESEIRIKSGNLDTGSRLSIIPQALSVDVLDYSIVGNGDINLEVLRGGDTPDIVLNVDVNKASFRRKQEKLAFVEQVDMHLQAAITGLQSDGNSEAVELDLKIPSAKITDMTAYNSYLPAHFPLWITGGGASLEADIALQQENAQGYVRLNTHDLSAQVDQQGITAELSTHIKLSGGQPQAMYFDISGSTITLDKVRVIGNQASFRDDDWGADINFVKANTVWKKPIQLDVEAELEMTDSIPLVSMLANHKDKHGWIEKALTVDDVAGDLNFQIANQQLVIPYAFAGSDNIDVGAKAIINETSRNGMVFVRYKALQGLLKINDGKRNIDILKAREKFDDYSTADVIKEKATQPDQRPDPNAEKAEPNY